LSAQPCGGTPDRREHREAAGATAKGSANSDAKTYLRECEENREMNLILYLAGLFGFLWFICTLGTEDGKRGFWAALFLFPVLAVFSALMHLVVWRG
jgi:hypothetical protein